MSESAGTNDVDQKYYIIWSFVGVTLMITLSFMVPFPVYFIVTLVAIFFLYCITTEKSWIKVVLKGIKNLNISYLSPEFGSGTNKANILCQSLIFSCMNCGNQHDEIACPKCGSKAVRPE